MRRKVWLAKLLGQLYICKCRVLRTRARIGYGLKKFARLEIKGSGQVEIGTNSTVSGIRGDHGQYVTLYTHNPEALISIGNNVRLYSARFSSRFSITVGDDVLIEESGISDTDFHSLDIGRGVPREDPGKSRIKIGNRVSIGDDVIVCPGSVVSKSIPSGSIVAGNPAKVIGMNKKQNCIIYAPSIS